MTTNTSLKPRLLSAARMLADRDGVTYFADENAAGISDYLTVVDSAFQAARHVSSAPLSALQNQPCAVRRAALEIASFDGFGEADLSDADVLDPYLHQAKTVLGALA